MVAKLVSRCMSKFVNENMQFVNAKLSDELQEPPIGLVVLKIAKNNKLTL